MPKISVVIPCFNHGAFLPETLSSLDVQTLKDVEVIVVDDGSSDSATVELLDRFEEEGRKIIRTANKGVSAARNRAIKEASGDLILPLDADDYIGPTYLEKAVRIFETQDNVGVVFCERQMFGERTGVDPLPGYDSRQLLVENLIYPAAVFRKEDWAAVGGYNEAMVHGWEDWDFWIALSGLGRDVVKLPDTMFFYRVRNISRDHSLKMLQKLHMYWLMMLRNRTLYLKHFPYLLAALCRIHLLGRSAGAG